MSERRIWKYRLENPQSGIEMPEGARILSLQVQDEMPCLWVLVNPFNPPERRYFQVVGTGWCLPGGIDRTPLPYVGTVQVGPLVWHVFEGVFT